MSTILNARYITEEEDGLPAMMEVVYDDKVEYPMDGVPESGGYDDVQAWISAGNTVAPFNIDPFVNTPDYVAQVRGA